jgi:hypothetical protein
MVGTVVCWLEQLLCCCRIGYCKISGNHPVSRLQSSGTPAAVFALHAGRWRQIGMGVSIFLAIVLLIEGGLQPVVIFALFMGSQPDPGCQSMDWHSNRSGNFIVCYPHCLVLAMLDEGWHRSSTWMIVLTLVVLFAGIWLVFLRTLSVPINPFKARYFFSIADASSADCTGYAGGLYSDEYLDILFTTDNHESRQIRISACSYSGCAHSPVRSDR